MKRKKEISVAEKYWKGMKTNLKDFLQTHDQEALHQFRVQVKKMKSFLVLLEAGSGSRDLLRHFKPVKKVFKKAGTIRDTHVHLQLGKRYEVHNPAFEEEQHRMASEKIHQFSRQGKKHLKKIRTTRRKLAKKIHSLPDRSIGKFYKDQLGSIASFLAHPRFDESLHDCRKQMKYLLHNEKPARKAIRKLPPLNIKYLDHLQEEIGQWHDNLLAIELFSAAETQNRPVAEQIRKENGELEKKIGETAAGFAEKVGIRQSDALSSPSS